MLRTLLLASLLAGCLDAPAPAEVGADDPALTATAGQIVARGLGQPYALVASGDSLFWVDGDAHRLLALRKDGGAPRALADGVTCTSPWGLAADAAYVYWIDTADGAVRKVPRGGGAAIVLARGEAPGALAGIAVDAGDVFWTGHDAGGHGVIRRLPWWGGAPITIATGADPTTLALDPWFVYAADASVLGGNNTIVKVPRGGGLAVTLSTGEDALSLAIAGTDLYWKRFWTGDVRHGATWHTGATTVAPNGGGWGDLAVDATDVWWTTGPLLHRSARLTDGDQVAYTAPAWAMSLALEDDPTRGRAIYLAIDRTNEAPDGSIIRVTP